MNRTSTRPVAGLGAVLLLAALAVAQPPAKPTAPPAKGPDLSEYRTVDTAITTQEIKATATVQPGVLGIYAEDANGKVVAADIALSSPADKAGIKRGDVLLSLDGKPLPFADALSEALEGKQPGETVKLKLERSGKPIELSAKLAPASVPQKPPAERAVLGIEVEARKNAEGVVIKSVTENSPARRANLKADEVILKIDGAPVTGPDQLKELLAAKKPAETLALTLLLAEKQVEYKVTLGSDAPRGGRRFGGGPGRPGGAGGPGGWDRRVNPYWTKDAYKLAIIIIEYPDAKIQEKVPAKAWNEAMFSKGTYKKTATGQDAHGSLYDYYLEQSYGHLKVSGKAFPPVKVSKKRAEYGVPGTQRTALLTEALDKLLERDGKDALKEFDGLIYIYSGPRMSVARGSLYWPHRSSVSHQGKRWPYFICGEGSERNGVFRMGDISVFAHEFGHMLGMPDLYARPENPGSEGLYQWCAMSNQAGNGRPQHFSAWCKEKLGWVKPTVIDPTVPQKLILAPIEDSPKECYKVLVRPDGSEYLLLENRRKKGFDTSLPAEGLLIWRVVGNRPILEESHGVAGPAGPRVFATSVPYPSTANDSFTPFTTPSSRSQLGGGLPVHITNIRRLPDGRVTFHIGYEYQ